MIRVLAGAAALAWASASGAAHAQPVEQLSGTAWRVYYGFGGQGLGSSYTVQFDTDGYVRGPTVCTRYAATYRQTGRRLTIGPILAVPGPDCRGATAEQDRRFLAVLQRVRGFRFEPPPQPQGWSGPLLVLETPDDRASLQRADVREPEDETLDVRRVAVRCEGADANDTPGVRYIGADRLQLTWGRIGRATLTRIEEDRPLAYGGDGHVWRLRGNTITWERPARLGRALTCLPIDGDALGGGPTDFRAVGHAPEVAIQLRIGGSLVVERPDAEPLHLPIGAGEAVGDRVVYSGGRGRAVLSLRQVECSDRLTGRRYPVTVQLSLQGQTYRACGSGRLR